MKKYISRFLKSIAFFLISFPVSYILGVAIFFNISFNRCIGILLSPSYFFISLIAILSGYGIWEMRRWAWYVFIFLQIFIIYENAVIVNSFSDSHHRIFLFFLGILFQIIISYKVYKEIRVPYFFPRIRWWESNPRYRFSAYVKMQKSTGESFDGEILDLSLSGCFIKTIHSFIQDELVNLAFSKYGYSVVCKGRVVWFAQSAVTHPKGIGIKFGMLSKSQKRIIRFLLKILKKTSTFYRRYRYLYAEEDFLKEFEIIEKKWKTKKNKFLINKGLHS